MQHLFHLLLNWLMFGSTMMLAAGAPAIGGGDGGDAASVGDGGGDGASDAEGSRDGADAGADATGTENIASDTEEERISGEKDDPNAPVDLGDGRQVPAKWKKLFDTAKEQGIDKEVKQLFFGMQRLGQKFPGGIKEAVELAEAIEEHGGLDAIAQLKSDLDIYHADAEAFSKDPEKWVESGFQEDAEASLKAFAHSLDYVSEHHPEHYNHLLGKVVINTLDGSPVHDIYALLDGMKDNPQAQELAGKLAGFYNGIKKFADKIPEKKVDAERAKLDKERATLASEQENLRNHTVNSQTIPLLGRQMTTALEREAKAVGFDLKKFSTEQPGAWQALRGEILNRVMNKAASDKTFCRNYKSVLAQGDTKRAVAMMNKKHDAILPEIVREMARAYGIVRKGVGRPGTAGQRQAGKAGGHSASMLRVNGKPDPADIDWGKTGDKIYERQAFQKSKNAWVTWA